MYLQRPCRNTEASLWCFVDLRRYWKRSEHSGCSFCIWRYWIQTTAVLSLDRWESSRRPVHPCTGKRRSRRMFCHPVKNRYAVQNSYTRQCHLRQSIWHSGRSLPASWWSARNCRPAVRRRNLCSKWRVVCSGWESSGDDKSVQLKRIILTKITCPVNGQVIFMYLKILN